MAYSCEGGLLCHPFFLKLSVLQTKNEKIYRVCAFICHIYRHLYAFFPEELGIVMLMAMPPNSTLSLPSSSLSSLSLLSPPKLAHRNPPTKSETQNPETPSPSHHPTTAFYAANASTHPLLALSPPSSTPSPTEGQDSKVLGFRFVLRFEFHVSALSF